MSERETVDHIEEDERQLGALRALLVHEEPVPPGLVARLHVAIVRAARYREQIAWENRVVVACLAFIALGASAPALVTGTLWVVLAVAVLAYAWLAVPRVVEPEAPARAPVDGEQSRS